MLCRKRPTKNYYAFGDGYRRCAGRQMAFSEMKMYLYKVLKNYKISLTDPTQKLNIKTYVTVQAMMAVEEPIKLLVKKRWFLYFLINQMITGHYCVQPFNEVAMYRVYGSETIAECNLILNFDLLFLVEFYCISI